MTTVFERIFSKEIPATEVYRNDKHGILIFLDNFATTRGHMLIIPKEPVDLWQELSPVRMAQLSLLANTAGRHATKILNPAPQRVAQLISGYGVPHVHLHVIPSYERNDTAHVFDYERVLPNNAANPKDLEVVRDELAFPPELVQHIDEMLDRLATAGDTTQAINAS
jgi:diadenosine tetraphosphate (Ap4A) HIT family hydrolase